MMKDMVFAFFLAFLAALANASSSLLQRKANKDGKNRHLMLRPIWLLGLGIAFVSFALQAVALSLGSLAAVEPVLALELAAAVLGSALFFRAPIGKQEWTSIALMTAGTVGLIVALNPQKRDMITIPAWQWLAAIGLSAALTAACCAGAWRIRRAEYRAALLGLGTGVAFGLGSSLLKGAMLVLKQSGIASTLLSWQLYAALAASIFSFWLLQRALGTGKLVASQPGITLADPFVAIAWGGLVYGEKMSGGFAIIFAVAAALVLSAGAILLSRAPALTHG